MDATTELAGEVHIMSPVLKTELLALLRGSGQLAETVEWDDADHAIPRRLGEEWTDDSEHTSLWEVVEADARKLGGRRSSGVIFQELIWYAVTAWQIAKGVESGDDPIKRERETRRKYLLHLADNADALAKYYWDNTIPVGRGRAFDAPAEGRGNSTRASDERAELATTSLSFRVFQHLIRSCTNDKQRCCVAALVGSRSAPRSSATRASAGC